MTATHFFFGFDLMTASNRRAFQFENRNDNRNEIRRREGAHLCASSSIIAAATLVNNCSAERNTAQ
jgi:hypothetical protein